MKSEKHIKVTGYSTVSWKDAIIKSIDEASKTLDNLTSVTVLKQIANIQNNKICEYLVELEITFMIEAMVPTTPTDESEM